MTCKIEIPQDVQDILAELKCHGYEACVVGGCVRDALLGKVPHDWDICTAAEPCEVIAAFSRDKVVETGLKHGTVTICRNRAQYEVTTYRVDGSYTDGRHPDEVTYTGNLREDLARRDFTINAMAYAEGKLIDPFGGQADLAARKIRCVGEPTLRFREDGLRILRALRFASVLDFAIEETCSQSIHANVSLLKNISKERICAELCRLLMGDYTETVLLAYADVMAFLIPAIFPMIGFTQHNVHHDLDVWQHTARAVACAEKKLIVRLALLLHDIGKPKCYCEKNGEGHFYGHAQKSEEIAADLLKDLRFSRETEAAVLPLIKFHDAVLTLSETAVKRWLNRLGEQGLRDLVAVQRGDAAAQNKSYAAQKIEKLHQFEALVNHVVASRCCFCLKDLQVHGNDLKAIGFREGKAVGIVLQALLTEVIDGTLVNEKAVLLQAALRYKNEEDVKQGALCGGA